MITLPQEVAEMLLAASLKVQSNQTSIVEKMSETLSQLTRFIEHSDGSLNEKLDTLNENVATMLTPNEFCHITETQYDMAKFYELPKLHKSEYLSRILGHERYIHLPGICQKLDGRPIVVGPSYYTSGLSQMLDTILQPMMKLIVRESISWRGLNLRHYCLSPDVWHLVTMY